jgi:hypothetical protein
MQPCWRVSSKPIAPTWLVVEAIDNANQSAADIKSACCQLAMARRFDGIPLIRVLILLLQSYEAHFDLVNLFGLYLQVQHQSLFLAQFEMFDMSRTSMAV